MNPNPINDTNLLRGKRVMVTGAAGFVGSNLTRKLLRYGCRVVGLDKPSVDCWRINDIINKIEFIEEDLRTLNVDKLQARLSDVQIIYHLGAGFLGQTEEEVASVVQTNAMGTLYMLQLANRLCVERFVNCGSCFEYGSGSSLSEDLLPKPITEYGASKTAAMMIGDAFYCKYGLPVISLRPFTVYGPFEAQYRLIPHTILCALDGIDIELTGGEQTRDFVFVDDIVDAFLAASVAKEGIGEIFNISTGREVSVKELVSTIMSLTNSKAKPLFGAKPYRESELWSLSGDTSRMQSQLSWSAQYSLEDGLKKTIQWFRENRAKYPEYAGTK